MTENSTLTFIFRDVYWIFASISFIGIWKGTILFVSKYKEAIGKKGAVNLSITDRLVVVCDKQIQPVPYML
jgi:hypothetical protein